MKTRPEIVNK